MSAGAQVREAPRGGRAEGMGGRAELSLPPSLKVSLLTASGNHSVLVSCLPL